MAGHVIRVTAKEWADPWKRRATLEQARERAWRFPGQLVEIRRMLDKGRSSERMATVRRVIPRPV